jgi:hypothetical protein
MYPWQATSLKAVKTDQRCKMELNILEKYYLYTKQIIIPNYSNTLGAYNFKIL